MARLGIQDILALADYWVTTFIDGHQEVSYVDSKDGRRHTWIVPRGLVVPPSRMTIARSESRRFKDYLDRTIAHSAKRKNAEDGDVLLEMARRDTSQAEARRIVRWKRNVRAQWRELLAEFRDRDWAQKPLSDATIDAATLARRNEAHRRQMCYRASVERLADEAPPGWHRSEMEKSVFKPLDKALKVAQQGDDPLAFEQALEHLAMAFRRSFAAWRSLS